MDDGEDWLMRPVLRGLCKYESLKDGTLGLEDLAIMNEALDVDECNRLIVESEAIKSRGTS
jgi:hypothetical protein